MWSFVKLTLVWFNGTNRVILPEFLSIFAFRRVTDVFVLHKRSLTIGIWL